MDIHELDAQRSTVATPSGDISYVAVGEGPAAVFVHGVGTNAFLWRNVLGRLPGRRGIALDLPAHGRSPAGADQDLSLGGLADAVVGLCDALGLAEIDLVGNDTGGGVAHIVAARAAVFAMGYESPDQPPLEVVDAFLRPVLGSPEAALRFEELLAGLDPTDLLAAEPALRELTVPTLVVWGTGDEFFELRWAHWLRDTIPGVTEVVELPGARLFFPDERADELVPLLERHWA